MPSPAARIFRRYREQTLVLETEIETRDAAASIIDFMPPREKASDVVRLVCGKRGRLAMRMELVLRFDYGSLVPWVTRLDDGTLASRNSGSSPPSLSTKLMRCCAATRAFWRPDNSKFKRSLLSAQVI
jgi:hypothetical protein